MLRKEEYCVVICCLEISQRPSDTQAWLVISYLFSSSSLEFCETAQVYQGQFFLLEVPEVGKQKIRLETGVSVLAQYPSCFSPVDIRLLAEMSQTIYSSLTSSQAASGLQWKTEHLSAFLYLQLSSPYVLTEVKKTSKSN